MKRLTLIILICLSTWSLFSCSKKDAPGGTGSDLTGQRIYFRIKSTYVDSVPDCSPIVSVISE